MRPASVRLNADGGQTSVWLPDQPGGRHGGFSTLNTSDWPNDAAVCSLSQILETGPIPQRFYLSAKACAGICRRAEKRGKVLPTRLRKALESVARSGGGRTSGPIDQAACLTANGGGQAMDFEVETFVVETTCTLTAGMSASASRFPDEQGALIAHALRGEGFDASEDGTGRGTPIVPVCFSCKDHGADAGDDVAPTMRAMGHGDSHANGGGQLAVAFAVQERAVSENPDAGPDGIGVREGLAYTLEARGSVQAVAFRTSGNSGAYETGERIDALTTGTDQTSNVLVEPYTLMERGRAGESNLEYRQDGTANAILTPNGGRGGFGVGAIAHEWAVRRLTPLECERFQGFPDGYTAISRGNKSADQCPDGPRYKALGNSMAVPVMRWIAQRLEANMQRVRP